MKPLIKDMMEQEKPYEKCLANGPESLSDAELLAIIIRTGTKGESSLELARSVLTHAQNYRGLVGLAHLSVRELRQIKGIGSVKAIQLKCISELAKRMAKASIQDGIYFNHPQTVAEYFMEEMRHKEREELVLLFLNSKNKLLHQMAISVGTVNSSVASPREIFIEALRYQAVTLIMLHNHPSGDPTPSADDVNVTRRVRDVGNLIGILLADHIIIGDRRYISMKEKGIL
jgi:DNA repair protein RadC